MGSLLPQKQPCLPDDVRISIPDLLPPPPPPPSLPRGRRSPLSEIDDSPEHKLKLKLWEKEEDILRQRIDRKENRRSTTQNEIYQLFGLFFVFQGVVVTALFTAAAQPNSHTCKYWWSPFTLSLIVSVATVSAVLHKLHDQVLLDEQLENEKADSFALFRIINQLREEGKDFDLEQQPQCKGSRRKKRDVREGPYCLSWWKGFRSYTGIVTLVLLMFSAVTLASCRLLLCNNNRF